VVETDASNLVILNFLSQSDNEEILHPVAYFLRKHSPLEINYEIYDEKLLIIICTFKEWHFLLKGSSYTIDVICT
jgi:hypothetical protein